MGTPRCMEFSTIPLMSRSEFVYLILLTATLSSRIVCTTARVLGGHKSARSAKIWPKTRPLTYLGNFITQIGQTDIL